MSVAKIIEVIGSSKVSFEDAVCNAIETAAKTIDGITSAWVKDQSVKVVDGKVEKYKVVMKITFVLKEETKAKKK